MRFLAFAFVGAAAALVPTPSPRAHLRLRPRSPGAASPSFAHPLRPPFATSEGDLTDGEPPSTGATLPQSSFNLVKNIVGAGVLSLPAGLAAGTGLYVGLAIAALLGAYSMWTFSIIGRLCAATGERSFNGLGRATRGPGFAAAMDVSGGGGGRGGGGGGGGGGVIVWMWT